MRRFKNILSDSQRDERVQQLWAGGENFKVSGIGYAPEGGLQKGAQTVDMHKNVALAELLDDTLAAGEIPKVLSGREREAMSDAELIQAATGTAVFVRVTPEQKLRLVEALQAHGEVAAMTGDGVNDAPAAPGYGSQ